MNILDKIIAKKKEEVERLRGKSFSAVVNRTEIPTLRQQIQKTDHINIIAEIKRASPSKGEIQQEVDPQKQAKRYEKLGASAISVLTDKPFFNGTMKDLKAVREVVQLPILCKDFIIDPLQIERAKAAGANIILLIVAALETEQLRELYDYAKQLNLEVLVEVHNESEMEKALKLGAKIIGVNNRDLKTFHVHLKTTKRLAEMVKDPETIFISESGIQTKEDVEFLAQSGAQCILVGETLMRAKNLSETFKQLTTPLKEREI